MRGKEGFSGLVITIKMKEGIEFYNVSSFFSGKNNFVRDNDANAII